MNSEEFAPFEPRGLGSLESSGEVGPGHIDVARVLGECVTLTLRTAPKWISLGLLSGVVMALTGYFMANLDPGLGSFLTVVPLLFLMPATLAGYYRILLASKRNESLSFWAALSYGLGRSVRMLATGMVLMLAFWIVEVVVLLSVGGLCSSSSGPVLGIPLGIGCLIAVVYLGLRWQLAAVVCVLENRNFFQVLRRSYALSEGRLGSLTLTAICAGLLCFAGAGAAVVAAEAAFNGAPGLVQYLVIPVVVGLYAFAGLLPVTAHFLCYYYLTAGHIAGELPPEASDDPIGLSRM